MNFFDVTFAVRMNMTIASENDSVGVEDIIAELWNEFGDEVEISLSSFIEGIQPGTIEIIPMSAEQDFDN